MINLIPPQGKVLVRREYAIRALSVGLILAAGAICASAVALVPAYLLLRSQETHAIEKVADTSDSQTSYQDAQEALNAASVLVRQLDADSLAVSPRQVIARIEAQVTPAVIIQGLSFASSQSPLRVEVRGRAQTREDLRLFIDTLKDDPFFSDASVPVSDLARSTDLMFTATVMLAPQP